MCYYRKRLHLQIKQMTCLLLKNCLFINHWLGCCCQIPAHKETMHSFYQMKININIWLGRPVVFPSPGLHIIWWRMTPVKFLLFVQTGLDTWIEDFNKGYPRRESNNSSQAAHTEPPADLLQYIPAFSCGDMENSIPTRWTPSCTFSEEIDLCTLRNYLILAVSIALLHW